MKVPAKFGEDLCAVAFGMLLIPNIVMATQRGLLGALKLTALQLGFLVIASLFRKIPGLIYSQEFKSNHLSIDSLLYGVIMAGGLFTAYQAIVMI